MNWTFLFTLQPSGDARLVEFAKTLKASQLNSNFVLLHADGALLHDPICAHTVLFCGCISEHR